jgi:hypothetical protein
MKFFILTFLFVILTFSACEKSAQKMSDYFNHKETGILTELNYPNDSIGKPDFIYSFDDYIILSDPQLDYLLSSYNVINHEFSRFLKKGRGPNESLDVQQINQSIGENSFFVKSTFGQDFFIYSLTNDVIDFQQKVAHSGNCISSFWDKKLIISSQYGDKRYSVENIEDRQHTEFGNEIAFNNYPQNIISHILQGLCTGTTELKRFAWFSIYGEAYEIYDYSNLSGIVPIKQFLGVLPHVDMQQGNPVLSFETKIGIPSVTANDEYIFALYNEHILKDAITLRDDLFLCNKILIFDWNGNPVKLLQFDKLLRSISYNKQYNILYGVGYDDDSNCKIYSINISSLN